MKKENLSWSMIAILLSISLLVFMILTISGCSCKPNTRNTRYLICTQEQCDTVDYYEYLVNTNRTCITYDKNDDKIIVCGTYTINQIK